MWTWLLALAHAAAPEHHLTWDLAVRGQPIGTRELTVRYLPGGGRILESYTSVEASIGKIDIEYQQRMTAHATSQPADVSSVARAGGADLVEVQARWSPSAWTLNVTTNGRNAPSAIGASRLQLSTADLMDPQTAVPLGQFADATMLVAETGQIVTGKVEPLGNQELTLAGKAVPVSGYAWTSPEGRSEFWYTADGFLVRYVTRLVGVPIEGTLRGPPPTGIDDFPVDAGAGEIDAVSL